MSKKTPPKGIVKTEEAKAEDLVIEGSINYKIVLGEEVTLECDDTIQNHLAAAMIAKGIAERMKTDYRLRKDMARGTEQKKWAQKRYSKMIDAAAGLEIIFTDIALTILAKASKVE